MIRFVGADADAKQGARTMERERAEQVLEYARKWSHAEGWRIIAENYTVERLIQLEWPDLLAELRLGAPVE